MAGPFLNGLLPPAGPGAAEWEVVEAFPGLTFSDLTGLVAEPNSTRLHVTERNGRIYSFENDPTTTNKTLFLDLSANTLVVEDSGLLGVAFHPEFGRAGSTNRGYVYVWYQFLPEPVENPQLDTPGYNRLSCFTVPDGSSTADPASELVLINQFDRHVWHNGGGMFFHTNGFLYVSNGDEGGSNDQYGQAQKIDGGLFSGVLRIDVDMDSARSHPIRRQPQSGGTPPSGWPGSYSANYYVPNDNPWLDPGGAVLEEFYAIGLRSPHRITHDVPTDRIWCGDIGQSLIEEVDLIVKGANYQWSYREGSIPGPKAPPGDLIGSDTPPVHDYPRSDGNAVIGGHIYRGSEHAADLGGKYIFGDNGSGRIWAMTYDGANPPGVTYLCNMPAGSLYTGLSSFGVDHDNKLYMCKMGAGAKVYKLARVGSPPNEPPPLLSQTGIFTDLPSLVPSDALLPFDVASPLWSDAARKVRWMAVPTDGAPYGPGETIGFSETGSWTWPTGTVLVKHFELPIDETNSNLSKRLETRLLALGTNGSWYGLTYKWRDNLSDADLLDGALSETNLITTATGIRTQVWYYPSRQDCMLCHTPSAEFVLGPRTCQMNTDVTYPATGRTDNQLRALNHVNLFAPALNESAIPTFPKATPLGDQGATREIRVRSYLDTNCAHCHRPGGVRASFDARFDTPLESQNIVNGPVQNALGVNEARVVAPTSLARSILHVRMNSVTPAEQMPPLARNVVDAEAIAVIAEWINALPPIGPPPPPWYHQDVGPVGVAGDAEHLSGSFTVKASGVDIWDSVDSFHFVYRLLEGDATLTARVVSMDDTHPWALAGVMIRQNLSGGSPHAVGGVTPDHGVSFTRRATPSGTSSYTAGDGLSAPCWLRLERTEDVFTVYSSTDGITWAVVGSDTIAMAGTVYAGLAVTSHDNGVLGSAVFDQVLLLGPNVNNAPSVTPDEVVRYLTQGVSVPADVLVTNDIDVDGDTLFLADVMSPSGDGGSVTSDQATVRYWPPYGASDPDEFNYVITDRRGGMATGPVTVLVQEEPPVTETLALELGAGIYAPYFIGIPGFTYTVQYTGRMEPADWQNLEVTIADETGLVYVVDAPVTNSQERYYRAVRGIVP